MCVYVCVIVEGNLLPMMQRVSEGEKGRGGGGGRKKEEGKEEGVKSPCVQSERM